MYNILRHFHSGWAYLTLLMAVLFVVLIGYYAFGKKKKTGLVKKISLFTLIAFHVQFLAGLILYFLSPYSHWNDQTMKVAETRFFALEHPLMMILAVVFITLAHRKIKRSDTVKKVAFVLGFIALVLMMARMPWAVWWS